MSWTQDDVKRIQANYGDNATVTLEDEDTLNIKINEETVARERFLEGWLALVKEQSDVDAAFTVVMDEATDFEMVKASVEKHGLQLIPIEGAAGRYKIALKD